jgi:hypothetical protein
MLVQVQEFIRSSGTNENFMDLGNDELIRLAKGMGIGGRTVVHRAVQDAKAA